jgi:hypothetical protein
LLSFVESLVRGNEGRGLTQVSTSNLLFKEGTYMQLRASFNEFIDFGFRQALDRRQILSIRMSAKVPKHLK